MIPVPGTTVLPDPFREADQFDILTGFFTDQTGNFVQILEIRVFGFVDGGRIVGIGHQAQRMARIRNFADLIGGFWMLRRNKGRSL